MLVWRTEFGRGVFFGGKLNKPCGYWFCQKWLLIISKRPKKSSEWCYFNLTPPTDHGTILRRSPHDIKLQQWTTDPSLPHPATLSAWLRGSSWTWPLCSTLLSPEFALVRCIRIGSRRFENIQSNQSIFHNLQGDEHAGSESQRAGGDWHPKPRRQVETILLTQNGVKRQKCNILSHEIMYQGQLDLLSWLLPDRVGQDAQPNRGGGVSQYVAQLDHHHPETIAIC